MLVKLESNIVEKEVFVVFVESFSLPETESREGAALAFLIWSEGFPYNYKIKPRGKIPNQQIHWEISIN